MGHIKYFTSERYENSIALPYYSLHIAEGSTAKFKAALRHECKFLSPSKHTWLILTKNSPSQRKFIHAHTTPITRSISSQSLIYQRPPHKVPAAQRKDSRLYRYPSRKPADRTKAISPEQLASGHPSLLRRIDDSSCSLHLSFRFAGRANNPSVRKAICTLLLRANRVYVCVCTSLYLYTP